MKLWRLVCVVLALAAGVSACGEDTSSGVGGDYTQVGDVNLDTALGDGVTSGDAADGAVGTDDTIGGTDVGDAEKDGQGTDALTDTGPAKYPDCLSLIGCVAQSCPASNWATGCDAVCLTGSAPSVATAYGSVSSCIQSVCRDGLCKGSSDPKCINECIGQKCMGKVAVCGADGKTGTAICGSYFTCSQACSTNAEPLPCISGCYAALSSTAQSQYAALDACASAAGGGDAFAACPEQVLVCTSGGASGSKTCIDALACSSTCDTGTDAQKSACITACWAQTAPAAQTAFAGALKCQSVSKSGCVASMLTCTDPSGNATCTATITCTQGCQQADPQAKATCTYGCLHGASKVEAKKLLDLQVCMSGCACKGDKTCENACLTGVCKAALASCQAP